LSGQRPYSDIPQSAYPIDRATVRIEFAERAQNLRARRIVEGACCRRGRARAIHGCGWRPQFARPAGTACLEHVDKDFRYDAGVERGTPDTSALKAQAISEKRDPRPG